MNANFWNHVKVRGPNDCWEWQAYKDAGGYGVSRSDRKVKKAHRISYEFHKGEIPTGLCVMHSCDNRSCVNPNHLSIGTHLQNSQDCVKKGRNAKGEKVGCATLADQTVVDIRIAYANGTKRRDIVRKYCINDNTFKGLIRPDKWKHLYGFKNCPTYEELKTSIDNRPKGNSDLTLQKISEIRQLLSEGAKGAVIARAVGVSVYVVSDIKRGKCHGHVTTAPTE